MEGYRHNLARGRLPEDDSVSANAARLPICLGCPRPFFVKQ